MANPYAYNTYSAASNQIADMFKTLLQMKIASAQSMAEMQSKRELAAENRAGAIIPAILNNWKEFSPEMKSAVLIYLPGITEQTVDALSESFQLRDRLDRARAEITKHYETLNTSRNIYARHSALVRIKDLFEENPELGKAPSALRAIQELPEYDIQVSTMPTIPEGTEAGQRHREFAARVRNIRDMLIKANFDPVSASKIANLMVSAEDPTTGGQFPKQTDVQELRDKAEIEKIARTLPDDLARVVREFNEQYGAYKSHKASYAEAQAQLKELRQFRASVRAADAKKGARPLVPEALSDLFDEQSITDPNLPGQISTIETDLIANIQKTHDQIVGRKAGLVALLNQYRQAILQAQPGHEVWKDPDFLPERTKDRSLNDPRRAPPPPDTTTSRAAPPPPVRGTSAPLGEPKAIPLYQPPKKPGAAAIEHPLWKFVNIKEAKPKAPPSDSGIAALKHYFPIPESGIMKKPPYTPKPIALKPAKPKKYTALV